MRSQAPITNGNNPAKHVRVLHVSDHLGGGGTERLIWDIVRLSQNEVSHRVVTYFPDGFFGPFVYAERLRELGIYQILAKWDSAPMREAGANGSDEQETPGARAATPGQRRAPSFMRPATKKIPIGWKLAIGSIPQRVRAWLDRVSIFFRVHVPGAYRILREYARFRPDIVHVHGFYPFRFGVLFKVLFRRAVVHTVPCTFAQMRDQGTAWLPDLYRKYHRRIDKFFLAAPYREEMGTVGVPPDKFVCIRGGVDFERVAQIKNDRARYRAEVLATLGLPQDALIALSIGRLHSSKGHQFVLEALPRLLKRFPDLHWIVLGEGDLRAQLEAQREELGLTGHAHFVGHIDDPLRFCAAADIFLRTAIFEGDNLSSYSALAMSLPVVGFKTENEFDFIPQVGHGVQVKNCDSDALAEATEQILSLPDRGRAMGLRGAEFSAANLDVRTDVGNFVSTYVALAQR